ncbi:MAG: SCO family protein [Planctomycetes bacterium]|nr:SCO family protein [Planctomycetota bacterium]
MALALSGEARAQLVSEVPKKVGFDQLLDNQVPLDLQFRDETGAAVRLSSYMSEDSKKPVVLLFVYYECPMLCTQVLNGFVRALRALGLEPGKDFEILTVSINHREAPELAAKKKANYIDLLGRPEAAPAWHFLTGDEPSIAALAQATGFRFMWDPEIEQYAHAGGLVVLTPKGRVSRYFFDVEFQPRDLRYSLIEASGGAIGSLTDRVLLLCYHYDPTTGKYGIFISNFIRLFCVLTVVGMGSYMFVMVRRERRLTRAAAAS